MEILFSWTCRSKLCAFPAELTSPISGSTVSPVNGVITLQWSCTDADNDLASFSVYLDATDGSTLLETLDYTSTTTSMETTVASSTVYYWKVVAVDSEGNQSDSGFLPLERTRLFCLNNSVSNERSQKTNHYTLHKA